MYREVLKLRVAVKTVNEVGCHGLLSVTANESTGDVTSFSIADA